jgi:hypothetical protein
MPSTEKPCSRGTSNSDVRGNTATQRRRRQAIVQRFRADVDVLVVTTASGHHFTATDCEGNRTSAEMNGATVEVIPACRCYRCGELLSEYTVSIDRIVPGIEGGTYAPENTRPACLHCNSLTGGVLGAARKKAS